jgi:arylamine N-acetyltransferase
VAEAVTLERFIIMPSPSGLLSPALTERVLASLGLSRRPDPTLEGLESIYAAWCQRVPFDNVRKMIHLRVSNPAPLPGSTEEDFFEAWLKWGTGGTCWPGAGACHALLKTLGFDAVRGVGTMLVLPTLPPNHATVRVSFGRDHYLVDCSMLCGAPLRLDQEADTEITQPAWGLRTTNRERKIHIAWRPIHKLDGFECRLEGFGPGWSDFESRYDQTRAWSPFNFELSIRLNRGENVIGAGFGRAVKLGADGSVQSRPMSKRDRDKLLIEEFRLSEEIVDRLPNDIITPPPPWSHTAEEARRLQRVPESANG